MPGSAATNRRGSPASTLHLAAGESRCISPLNRATAAQQVREVLQRAPVLLGYRQSRWTLRLLAEAVSWFHDRPPGTIARVLHRLGLAYRRGRTYLHSPDPAYEAKLRTITGVQVLARAEPDTVVFLYEDELAYHRRALVAREWAPRAVDAPRVDQGWTANTTRRIACCLDATSGRLIWQQRTRFPVPTMSAFYATVAAAYPDVEQIYIALDNWRVHFDAPTPSRVTLLPLPTYAPWTNPCEDLWRGLVREVLAHHPYGDDWAGVQDAVSEWLTRQAADPGGVLRQVGLSP